MPALICCQQILGAKEGLTGVIFASISYELGEGGGLNWPDFRKRILGVGGGPAGLRFVSKTWELRGA